MKKLSEPSFNELIGLGSHSARKSYYPELNARLDELEKERNQYKWLFDNAQHGIFQAALYGGVIVANQAFAQLCGYSDPGAAVHAIRSLQENLFGPGEFQRIEALLRQEGRLMGYETAIIRANGEPMEVSLNVLLRTDEADDLIEAFITDITERKRARQKLESLNQELEERVAQRTRELTALNDELKREIGERTRVEQELLRARDAAEAANRSKDSYLAAASHDLLQPMNAARLLVSTLQERQLQDTDAALVNRIHLALEGAEDLLTDLLDIAKLDRRAIEPAWEDFNIFELLGSLQSEFEPVAANAGLELRVRLSSYAVRSDYRLLSRILRNFLSNALRYTDRGGVHLGCRKRGDKLLLEVRDTGPGIPEDKLQEVFLEFRQLQSHPRGERRGVGLGLAIVERIAKIMDHPVQVRSRCGRGSTFSVAVPLVKSAPEPITAVGMKLVDCLDGARILVIDNEVAILDSMTALLRQWGCEVFTARDEAEALRIVLAGPAPDVVLADYHLDDGRTGQAAIAHLRSALGAPLPAAIITADRSDPIRQLLRAENLPVLSKPVKAIKLRVLLHEFLASANAGRNEPTENTLQHAIRARRLQEGRWPD